MIRRFRALGEERERERELLQNLQNFPRLLRNSWPQAAGEDLCCICCLRAGQCGGGDRHSLHSVLLLVKINCTAAHKHITNCSQLNVTTFAAPVPEQFWKNGSVGLAPESHLASIRV